MVAGDGGGVAGRAHRGRLQVGGGDSGGVGGGRTDRGLGSSPRLGGPRRERRAGDELRAVQERHSDVRRTTIIDSSGAIGMEDLIADEDMVVTMTSTGYIKRTPLSEYRTQRRGGRRYS